MNILCKTFISLVLVFTPLLAMAQPFLGKHVNIDARRKSVGDVLKQIEKQGGFYFSYNSTLIRQDSLVSLSAQNKPVKQLLGMLFGNDFEYTETKTHIVIQAASAIYWYATGYVKDELTGEGIAYASVYEKTQFVSTLTNELGYFRLRLRDRNKSAVITVSKSWYTDTAIMVNPGSLQDLQVDIKPKDFELDSFVVNAHHGIENNWLSRLFLSSKQRMQSINIGRFFADKPYQTSLIPGMGTHGRMSSQSVNKFSFNLLGGYTGGVNGFELGGGFNINKTNVQGLQIGGIFNMADGKISGLQIAGAYNHVMKASEGWQLAGISNMVNDDLTGVQISGAHNHVWGTMKGLQISGMSNLTKEVMQGAQISGALNYANNGVEGIQVTGMGNIAIGKVEGTQIAGALNYANDTVNGTQIAGLANIARKEVSGTQICGLINYTRHVKGVQIGLINVADTSSGASIGLINFIAKGYHKISISSNEVTNLHLSAKLGTRNAYTLFSYGINTGQRQAITWGYGFGRQFIISKKISINPELSMNQLYLGDWNFVNGIFRLELGLHYKIHKYLGAFISPSYNYCYKDQVYIPGAYRKDLPYTGVYAKQHSNFWSSWLGWSIGLTIL